MFDELSSRFEDAVKGLRGEAKISENNINDALKEVKKALLDADVSSVSYTHLTLSTTPYV